MKKINYTYSQTIVAPKSSDLGMLGIRQSKTPGKYNVHLWFDHEGRYIGSPTTLASAKLLYNYAAQLYAKRGYDQLYSFKKGELTVKDVAEAKQLIDQYVLREGKKARADKNIKQAYKYLAVTYGDIVMANSKKN